MDEYAFLNEYGNCSAEKVEINFFFPESPSASVLREQEKAAKKLCNECVVKSACVQVAIKNGEYGIWGGTTERERFLLKRRMRYKDLNN